MLLKQKFQINYSNFLEIKLLAIKMQLNLNDINFVIWDSKSDNLNLCTNRNNSNIILNEMKNRKYPEMCINYLTTKL